MSGRRKLKGSCLCGQIRYEVHGAFIGINYCHCKQCRKASGSAFGTSAAVSREEFNILAGHAHLAAYQSTPGKKRYFCRNCGSPLYSHRQGAEVVYVRLGTLDDDPGARPDVHIHVASKASWYDVDDNLPKLDGEEGLWF